MCVDKIRRILTLLNARKHTNTWGCTAERMIDPIVVDIMMQIPFSFFFVVVYVLLPLSSSPPHSH
jgi:hypothetical protein